MRTWNADDILSTARAFQPAAIVTAAAELDVFTVLHASPSPAHEVAARLATDPRATAILLDALVALGLLLKQGQRYSVPKEIGELLTETGSQCILPAVRHLGNCLSNWAHLAEIVKQGLPADRPPSTRGQAEDHAAFIGAMDNFCAPIADAVVRRLRPLDFRHLLDIGAGPGTWTIALLRAVPTARATIFDLPQVMPIVKERIGQAGLTDRVTFVAGDYNVDELPAGVDVAWLSAVVHQNSRVQNRALYAKVFSALQPGGSLVIRDVVMDPSRTNPQAGALFAVNMLVATEAGGTYTFDEFREDLLAAGFADVELLHHDDYMSSLIRATKPGA